MDILKKYFHMSFSIIEDSLAFAQSQILSLVPRPQKVSRMFHPVHKLSLTQDLDT